ncbi:Fanconi anemia group D2 protein isoform X2 [Olea europaea var. sylvestris]|uniref:Fanconi anemia group D2 protein isoform X2 n=1 Tax=Olea europaea var. sylvestris TaxID=158386 RepID=UPI000C1D8997|nr:Fanconi anemia group D2 protein isoform X2 [Olea europaea var. sylvestris]
MKMLSRKRPSKSNNAFVPPFAQPNKLPKPATVTCHHQTQNDTSSSATPREAESVSPLDKMLSVLADAGCTLINPSGPPCIPSDLHKLRNHLNGLFSRDSSLREEFLRGFASYIASPNNFRRVLLPSSREGLGSVRSESLVRVLLLVHSVQLDLLYMLLEKLPEYFDLYPRDGVCEPSSSCLNEDVARLILNQFQWLDFLVDSEAFAEKLLQALSICPLPLKKEIIGSLPEIIGDQNNKTVISSLQQMLQEDSSIIVNVLDSFSNLNLDNLLQDQVITIALSCIRTTDVEHMPYLLRFLLLSVEPSNSRRIISQIREQLKFVGACHRRTTQHAKLKGKSVVNNTEASILDALRSSLRFKNEIIKELTSLEEAQDHKVIDLWLLTLVYMNNESLQKNVEKLLKKKIVEGCIQEDMFEQYINGIKDLSNDYLPTFLSISAYLLACKEQRAQEFGIHMYMCLFEGFVDAYSRQEVVGALIAHLGSGINCEVSAALETMVKLASKNSKDLIPFHSHINGILDYLEGFNFESLHKVYEVFTLLALSTRSSSQPHECSIANELLMILRKQINNPDPMYKKMGLIGTLKIVSYLADANNTSLPSLSQKSNSEEAMELLKLSLDSSKQLPLSLILFYEELVSTLKSRSLHPNIMEWVSKHVGDFESIYLFDLDAGCLPVQDLYGGLEGELWMNLDGNMSPICLNILPLVFTSFRSASPLQVLPANFVLLSVVERLANQGSLGGIDALLGCPLHLPSSKLFLGPSWQFLTGKQKQVAIFSLYYAANWMRELINTFSTQIVEGCGYTSQATKEEIIIKLLKRLRNLVFIESLLNNILEKHTVVLPELYPHLECSLVNENNYLCDLEKTSQRRKGSEPVSQNKKKNKKKASAHSANSDTVEKFKQPKIVDIWRKAGAIPSQENLNKDMSATSSKDRQSDSAESENSNLNIAQNIEVSAPAKFLEAQRYKFRPLSVDCFSILTFSEDNQGSCCADSAAELPLHLYLLRDLHKKLGFSTPPRKQNIERSDVPGGFIGMEVPEFLSKIRPLFPSLRRHLDRAVHILTKGPETCQDHWKTQSNLAAIPEMTHIVISTSPALASISVFKEILRSFGKMLNLPDIQKEKSILSDLLLAFQPKEIPNCFLNGMHPIPSPGNIDYLYSGAYAFLQGVFDVAITFSFILASEVVLTLESMVTSIRRFLESLNGNGKNHTGAIKELLPFLRNKLGTCAQKLLMHKCDRDDIDDNLKAKGEMVQRVLRIYLENFQSTSDLINELVSSVLSEVSSDRNAVEDDNHIFPTLCPATLVIWYRVMHEENLATLNNLVKEIAVLKKPRAEIEVENVERLLNKLQQSVNVVVSLVSMCRTNEKVTVHAMAVKYGGKFIDSFLKVFYFLQAQFQTHREPIIQLVKELQKATRTIQTLCSEAKGSKQTAITSKIPATKRSMERFLFHVKALLYSTSSGCTFWIGNLKHKDLMGHVVSSQAYVDEHIANADENPAETTAKDQPTNIASQ